MAGRVQVMARTKEQEREDRYITCRHLLSSPTSTYMISPPSCHIDSIMDTLSSRPDYCTLYISAANEGVFLRPEGAPR